MIGNLETNLGCDGDKFANYLHHVASRRNHHHLLAVLSFSRPHLVMSAFPISVSPFICGPPSFLQWVLRVGGIASWPGTTAPNTNGV